MMASEGPSNSLQAKAFDDDIAATILRRIKSFYPDAVAVFTPVHFDHLRHRHVQGHIQSNGDIKWANGKEWLKYEGEWQDPGESASDRAPHLPISAGSASESKSPESVIESRTIAVPTELAPRADLTASDDDVADMPCDGVSSAEGGDDRVGKA